MWRHTLTQRGSSQIQNKHKWHKTPYIRSLFVLGLHTRVRFLGGTKPHFLLTHPVEGMSEGTSDATQYWGADSPNIPSVYVNTRQHHHLHHACLPTPKGLSAVNLRHTPGWYSLCWGRDRAYPSEVSISWVSFYFRWSSHQVPLWLSPRRRWALGKQVPYHINICHPTLWHKIVPR